MSSTYLLTACSSLAWVCRFTDEADGGRENDANGLYCQHY